MNPRTQVSPDAPDTGRHFAPYAWTTLRTLCIGDTSHRRQALARLNRFAYSRGRPEPLA